MWFNTVSSLSPLIYLLVGLTGHGTVWIGSKLTSLNLFSTHPQVMSEACLGSALSDHIVWLLYVRGVAKPDY